MSLPAQAQTLAAALPPLVVEALRLAQAASLGQHGRRRAGSGDHFWQFRDYQGQDSATMIDWKQSARSDKLYVRERERLAPQTVYLWADRSGSMHYHSQNNPTKTERAHVLLLALAHLMLHGGEKIAWLTNPLTTAQGLPAFAKLTARLLPLTPTETNLPPTLPRTPNATLILASDFMADTHLWQKQLNAYAALNLRGILLHIADPEEDSPTFKGHVRMEGCENEPTLLLPQAESLHTAYRQKWKDHKTELQTLARRLGWHYVPHPTNTPPHKTLLHLITLLQK